MGMREWMAGAGVRAALLGLLAIMLVSAAGSKRQCDFGVVPETSTWMMLLAGFAGLGVVGYRKAQRIDPQTGRVVGA
jgi:hypothetical protein